MIRKILNERLKRNMSQLHRAFGPQGWWPRVVREQGTVSGEQGRWIVKHHPGQQNRWLSKTPRDQAFEVAVGAILTQNTAWSNVEKALVCLAMKKLLTSRAVHRAPLTVLRSCVRSSGYYKQKAKKLKLFARFVEKDLHGDLTNLPQLTVHGSRLALLEQWGIGPETADTILLYGLNVPIFVVDAYTRRLFVALSGNRRWLKRPYDDIQNICMEALPKSVKGWQEAHALIVAWGKHNR